MNPQVSVYNGQSNTRVETNTPTLQKKFNIYITELMIHILEYNYNIFMNDYKNEFIIHKQIYLFETITNTNAKNVLKNIINQILNKAKSFKISNIITVSTIILHILENTNFRINPLYPIRIFVFEKNNFNNLNKEKEYKLKLHYKTFKNLLLIDLYLQLFNLLEYYNTDNISIENLRINTTIIHKNNLEFNRRIKIERAIKSSKNKDFFIRYPLYDNNENLRYKYIQSIMSYVFNKHFYQYNIYNAALFNEELTKQHTLLDYFQDVNYLLLINKIQLLKSDNLLYNKLSDILNNFESILKKIIDSQLLINDYTNYKFGFMQSSYLKKYILWNIHSEVFKPKFKYNPSTRVLNLIGGKKTKINKKKLQKTKPKINKKLQNAYSIIKSNKNTSTK